MSGFLSILGWSFLPNLVTGWVQSIYYGITIRAGDPHPQPGTPRYAEHRRRIHILVVSVYLLYTIYEADFDLRRAGSFYTDLGAPLDATDRDIKARFRRLAAQFHPDKMARGASSSSSSSSAAGPSADAINAYFVHLKTASDTLLDPARRFAYDRFGPDVVLWAAGGANSAGRCVTVYDFVARGVGVLLPYYAGTAAVLYVFGLMGYLTWGRYERWLVLACVLAFELHCVTRPTAPAVLGLINTFLRRSYAPFQAIQLARKISITTFLGFSQIGPLLAADTRRGKIDMDGGQQQSSSSSSSSSSSADDKELSGALSQLENLSSSLNVDVMRLLELEMAPFVGQGFDQDAAQLSNLRGQVRQWLVQNTIRSDPLVRDAVGQFIQRRRPDAPAGARGTR